MKLAFWLMFLSYAIQLHAKPCKKMTQALQDLYPHHSQDMIGTRIDKAKNKHKFMRGFIPYYYQKAFEAKESIPVHAKMKKTTGQIVGDAHVENFGFIVNNDGRPVLALNDFDDVAEAPLYLDVLRLTQSASYIEDIKLNRLIAAYKKGLTNSSYEFSGYIKKLNAKAVKGGNICKADYSPTKNGIKFSNKTAPSFDASSAEQKAVKKILTDKYGSNVKFHDIYRTMKESGGSAYGNRFHVLAEFDGQMQFIELKEVFDTGVISQFAKANTNDQRILTSRDVFLGKHFDKKLDVVRVENKSYQLRFKSEGNKSIDFGKIDDKDVHNVIEDEFFILGQLHRKSLDSSPAKIKPYLDDLSSVTNDEWTESVKVMKQAMKKAYDEVNE